MLEIDESLKQTEPDCRAGLGNPTLIVRSASIEDGAELVSLANNPALTSNLCNNWLPSSHADVEAWFAAQTDRLNNQATFLMTDGAGTCLGAASLGPADGNGKCGLGQIELSILVRKTHWNQGIATRTIQALADYAFSNPAQIHKPVTAITARCRASSNSAKRVMEKCGFQYCGTGMAHSSYYRGMIPIDRFRLDRGIWRALKEWRQAPLSPIPTPLPQEEDRAKPEGWLEEPGAPRSGKWGSNRPDGWKGAA